MRLWPRLRRRPGCSRAPRCSRASTRASSRSSRKVAVPRSWERGEILFREGDAGDTCYLVRSGAVLLTREHQDGRMVALAELRAGDLFGELAMFRGERARRRPRRSRTPRAWRSSPGTCSGLLRRNPDLALKLLAALAERVSVTTERLAPPVLPDGGRPRGRHPARAAVSAPGRGRRRPRRADPRHPGRDRAALRAPRARARAASWPRSSAPAWSRSGAGR